MEEMITITLAEYQRLQAQDTILNALEAHCVDNWEGYDDAMESLLWGNLA